MRRVHLNPANAIASIPTATTEPTTCLGVLSIHASEDHRPTRC